jgi:hypothetical protein
MIVSSKIVEYQRVVVESDLNYEKCGGKSINVEEKLEDAFLLNDLPALE